MLIVIGIKLDRDPYKPTVFGDLMSGRVFTLPVSTQLATEMGLEARYCRRKTYVVREVVVSVLWN